jgi:hypothetical protein
VSVSIDGVMFAQGIMLFFIKNDPSPNAQIYPNVPAAGWIRKLIDGQLEHNYQVNQCGSNDIKMNV